MTDYDDERADEEDRRVEADELMEGMPYASRSTEQEKYLKEYGEAFNDGYQAGLRERGQQIIVAIAATLNSNVTLNSVSDAAGVPNSLAQQARRDAIALIEAIALLKGEQSCQIHFSSPSSPI